LLFLLNAACLAQKQIVFGLTRAVLEPTFYYTRGSKHYATDAVLKNICARFVNYKKDVFDSQPQIIKSTSCLHMVNGSLWLLRLLPPLKLVAMI
jgi:hypothetical protein